MRQNKRAVFLDAGGTLIHLDRGFVLNALAEQGVHKDEAAFLIADRAAREHRAAALRTGQQIDDTTSWRIYAAKLLEVLECTGDAAAAVGAKVRERHRAGTLWTMIEPGTEETLAQLRDIGYRLVVVSNADGRVGSFLEHAGLAKYLDAVVDSGKVGVEKPDPRIFEIALGLANVSASEAVHVGDVYEIDVLGARAAGLDAILLAAHDGNVHTDVPVIRSLPEVIRLLAPPDPLTP